VYAEIEIVIWMMKRKF